MESTVRTVEWTVVGSGVGPLFLAATEAGLVNVVFHAEGAVRERALSRLVERLGGPEPVRAARVGWPSRYGCWRRTSTVG